MTLEQLLDFGKKRLQEENIPEPDWNAWYLLQDVLKTQGREFRRSDFFMRRQEEIVSGTKEQYDTLLERRCSRMPLEYIIGNTEFMGLMFEVNPNVLIPRQDTEVLVEQVLTCCNNRSVLDLCTGSGCIGLSVAVLGNPSHVVLSDVSEGACMVAEKNREWMINKEGLQVPVEIVCGDLWESVSGKFDVIVSNPPYIETEVIPSLMPEVRSHEPVLALDGGKDGMLFYRSIVEGAGRYLNPGGMLCLEIGYNQGERVLNLMREHGFENVEIKKDLAGLDRVVSGRLEESDV